MTADAKGEGMECPCDVHLPPGTYFRKGVALDTVLRAIESRRGGGADCTTFMDRPNDRAPSPSQGVPPPGYHVAPCNSCHGAKRTWDHTNGEWGEPCELCQGKGVQCFPPANVAFAELREKFGDDFNGASRVSDEQSQAVVVSEEMVEAAQRAYDAHHNTPSGLATGMSYSWSVAMRAALIAALESK